MKDISYGGCHKHREEEGGELSITRYDGLTRFFPFVPQLRGVCTYTECRQREVNMIFFSVEWRLHWLRW